MVLKSFTESASERVVTSVIVYKIYSIVGDGSRLGVLRVINTVIMRLALMRVPSTVCCVIIVCVPGLLLDPLI